MRYTSHENRRRCESTGGGYGNHPSNDLTVHYAHSFAQSAKRDPVQRVKSKRFGITSIIFSVLAVPFAALVYFSLSWLQGDGILLLIFLIALLAIGIVGMLLCVINAVGEWILQIYVNRRAVTRISLVFLLAGLGGCAYFVLAALHILS